MCGIWVYLNTIRSLTNEDINRYLEYFNKVKNRGPDNSTIKLINDNCIFGFHRLAIMGLSDEGNQPFYFENYKCFRVVVANAEIYNWKELKEEYLENYNFKSNSDCEIILPLFDKIGLENMLDKIIGVFAFVIYEYNKITEKYKIYVARDRIGIRPLFYGFNKTLEHSNEIGISSEIKGLTELFTNIKAVNPGEYHILSIEKCKIYYEYNVYYNRIYK